MPDYEAVIGLEVHAQLKTVSKLFCGCSTSFGQSPNTHICPVCSGMPGTLPVVNKKAVEYALKMALALGCTINKTNTFARKNYFYPDLPMGYQISQFDLPIAEHGEVVIDTVQGKKTIGITRIHMENDAGKSIHSQAENVSFIDLNRAGTPLIEIVSEPELSTPEEAEAYLRALHEILTYLDICDGNMEEGSFRCDANVSIRLKGEAKLGTRTELKNMNSFRNVRRAVAYEINRQKELLEDGEAVVQQTRLFNADTGVTHAMRGKEEAHDYRYFPDPDLMPLVLDEASIEAVKNTLPELPATRRERFIAVYGLTSEDAVLLTADIFWADYFEKAVKKYPKAKKIANWMKTDLLRRLNNTGLRLHNIKFDAQDFACLVQMVTDGAINQKAGQMILADLLSVGGDPKDYAAKKGLAQISDTSALENVVDEVMAENPKEVAALKDGKKQLLSFFVGQIMKKTKGQANPGLASQLLSEKLSKDK